MAGNKEAARKRTAKLLAKDPDHFKKLGAKGKKGGKLSPGSFTSETGAAGGAKGKRKPIIKNKQPKHKLEEKTVEIVSVKKYGKTFR
jgi:general stress protein YciG